MTKYWTMPFDAREAAIEHWSIIAGKPAGEEHPTIARAIRERGEGPCLRAWGKLTDKLANPEAQPVRSREALFVFLVKDELG